MSDNEHALASLGHAEVLSVQNSVGEPIPEFRQRPEDGTKIPSVIETEETWHVLADEPAWPCLIQESHNFPPQS